MTAETEVLSTWLLNHIPNIADELTKKAFFSISTEKGNQ